MFLFFFFFPVSSEVSCLISTFISVSIGSTVVVAGESGNKSDNLFINKDAKKTGRVIKLRIRFFLYKEARLQYTVMFFLGKEQSYSTL